MFRSMKWRMLLLCIALPVSLAQAGDYGTSSGILLKNHFSPRGDGMAGAQAAVTVDEAGALSWNPAGLVGHRQQEVSTFVNRGLIDDLVGGVTYSCSLDPTLALGGGVLMYDAGSFELVSAAGDVSLSNAQREVLAYVTGAYRSGFLGEVFAVGINLKVLNSTLLDRYSAFAIAADVGFRWEPTGWLDHFNLGAAIKNLGTPMKYVEQPFPLPLYGIAGLGYQILQGDQFELLLAADAQYDQGKNWNESIGAEFWIFKQVALRGGYKFGTDLSGLTLGAGLRLDPKARESLQVDYAFALMEALNSVHRISLTYSFGAPLEAKEGAIAGLAKTSQPNPTVPPAEITQPNGATEKLGVAILQIEKTGGRVSSVLLNAGLRSGIRVGMKGVILNAGGQSVAGICVQEANDSQCIAQVASISRDLGKNATAIIYRSR